MNSPTFLATLWHHREYGVAVSGAILIVLGIAGLTQQQSAPGWYAIVAGTLLIVIVVAKSLYRPRKQKRHSEPDDMN
ncbi:hypothetical protein [Nocardiopsis sp. MG754419]|uniref:hypothetical protein n=1 Tax=Nocardiopsis sp. MG754419 TaxID=2259865 RepID=UPI001BAB7222|nr:hypothetical protein [Nocardiopsis sp. MG754419]MBR8742628.1 hypothetical protein [Nocardiopsis sp. MG754419]